jgi:cell wall-associated NlpC family hydrolase
LPRTSEAQFKIGRPVPDTRLRPGDLVFFQTSAQPISHVGVWLGENQFVHASSGKGVIVSSLAEPYYSKRFRGAKRVLR